MYQEAYNNCKSDFDTCQKLVYKQEKLISTFENVIEVQKTRLSKFESLIYRQNGNKRKALGLYFIWRKQRKNF